MSELQKRLTAMVVPHILGVLLLAALTTLAVLLPPASGVKGVFLHSPQTQFAPLNFNATFMCIVSSSFAPYLRRIDWDIDNTRTATDLEGLNEKGIFVSALERRGLNGSLLTVFASQKNNQSKIACVVVVNNNSLESYKSESANLTVYGRPNSPTNLFLHPLAPLQLKLTWSTPYSVPGANLSYTVAVTAVNQKSEDRVGASLSVEVRNENWYVLKMDVPVASCSSYKFVVTAFNKVGASDPSEPVTGILPMLPNITGLVASVAHSVFLEEKNNISCNVTYQAATSCSSEYQITGYTLRLTDTATNAVISVNDSNTSGEQHLIPLSSESGLLENRHYEYHIAVQNRVGTALSPKRDLYTTDVTHTTASLQLPNLIITCHFLPDTAARGCYILLIAVGDKSEIKGMFVHRDNSSLNGEVEFVLIQQPGCYTVKVYDWEEDGSVGHLAVPVERKGVEWSQPCTTAVGTSPTKASPSPQSYLLPIVASAVGGVILLSALIFLVALGFYCQHKAHSDQESKETSRYTIEHSFRSHYPFPEDHVGSQYEIDSPAGSTPVVYDQPEHCKIHSNGVGGEYSTLTRLSSTHSSHGSPPASDEPNYAQLNALPEYACVEREVFPHQRQLMPLPPLPPLSPLAPLAREPPTYCEVPSAKDEMVNSMPSAGTTIY